MKIAFIGLRSMGTLMTRDLPKVGHVFSVLNLNTQAADMLVEASAVAAVSPEDAATDVETVIITLPAAAHVCHVLTAEDGVLAGIAKGVPIINSNTIDPASARAFGAMVAEHGSPFVDASVSSSTGGATADTLTFMVGDSTTAFGQMRPMLPIMGKNLVHCGDIGAGQGVRICSNLVLGIAMAGVTEIMSLREALGIDPRVLGGITNVSTRYCWSSNTYNPFPGVTGTTPSSRGCTSGFGTDLMFKDLGLTDDTAKSVRQPAYLGALAQQLYQTMSSKGDGELDFSAVIKLYWKDGAV